MQLFSSFALFVSFLLISESRPPRPQPCDLCVHNVFPFCFARASSSPAKYVTLHRGLPSGVSLKPLGSTCCSQINKKRMHRPGSKTSPSMPYADLSERCRRSLQLLDLTDHCDAWLQQHQTCFTLTQTEELRSFSSAVGHIDKSFHEHLTS